MKLWVDDEREPPDATWHTAQSARHALEALMAHEGRIKTVSLDHDLGDGPTGYDLLKTLEQYQVPLPADMRIHSQSPPGREAMEAVIARMRKR